MPYIHKSRSFINTGVAQLVELWSPKPGVVGSSPTTRAKHIEIKWQNLRYKVTSRKVMTNWFIR
jgi:hypothetical protein